MAPELMGYFILMQVDGTTDPANPELVGIQDSIQKRLEEMTIQQGKVTATPIEVQLIGLGYFG